MNLFTLKHAKKLIQLILFFISLLFFPNLLQLVYCESHFSAFWTGMEHINERFFDEDDTPRRCGINDDVPRPSQRELRRIVLDRTRDDFPSCYDIFSGEGVSKEQLEHAIHCISFFLKHNTEKNATNGNNLYFVPWVLYWWLAAEVFTGYRCWYSQGIRFDWIWQQGTVGYPIFGCPNAMRVSKRADLQHFKYPPPWTGDGLRTAGCQKDVHAPKRLVSTKMQKLWE